MSQDREHMAEIGRKEGEESGGKGSRSGRSGSESHAKGGRQSRKDE